jgi:hypothetical protein
MNLFWDNTLTDSNFRCVSEARPAEEARAVLAQRKVDCDAG